MFCDTFLNTKRTGVCYKFKPYGLEEIMKFGKFLNMRFVWNEVLKITIYRQITLSTVDCTSNNNKNTNKKKLPI